MSCVHACKITATSRVALEDRVVAPEVREALVASVPVEVQAEVGLEDLAL
jgi:hypothetical protein